MNAYQYDLAGMYVGVTEADESPLEPGVYLLPARCTLVPPPAEVPADQWPRWDGVKWRLVNRPVPANDNEKIDPLEKLRAFLTNNPDVAELLQSNDGGADV